MILCGKCRERLSLSGETLPDWGKKNEICELCGNLLEEIDDYFSMFRDESRNYEFKTFLIGLRSSRELSEKDKKFIEERGMKCRTFKEEFQYLLGAKIENELHYEVDFLKPDIVFKVNQENGDYDLWVRPVYLKGRYLKKRRGIPQSPWIDPRRGKGGEISISEYIGNAVHSSFLGKNFNFFASGREDVDALMLGNGRPFYVEVENPRKRNTDLSFISAEVSRASNGGVEITGLAIAEYGEIEAMKNQRPDKTYEVGITIEGAVPAKLEEILKKYRGLEIKQRTPTRVLSIRKDKVREREIRSVEIKERSGNRLILLIKAEAGTYVKEFITGDNGRTVPNLSEEMKVNVKIDYLNVLEVK
jgi:tRNA pseudouridine synthase 10